MGIAELRGSIVAIVTPFKANGEIDFEAFDRLVDFHIAQHTDGIVVCGTTGETPTLTEDEDAALIAHAVKRVNGRIPVIAGTGSNSTQECVVYTQKAASLGVDGVLIVAPYYNKPTQEGMYLHFSTVAKAVDVPVILYNVPGRTGSNISVKLALRLANEFKNIIGIKEAQGSLAVVTQLLAGRPQGFKVYSGDDFTSLSTNYLGADGCISVVANVIPGDFQQMMALSMNGEVKKANEIFFKYQQLMDLMFIESNPIPVKTALAHMGLMEEVFRAPLCAMESKNKEALLLELKKLGI
ncbi:4-hydroxy-tetrahydrodipicolinate synthase [Breznakibacter xylanolyticus]|uniref:4-hydroxy-tetrahydrodipicolinate synthase n=1 Tax=Breznakibacter xylanolyticus TaxID=990 RepID=A0A2W7NNK8_9BACT|nr:4-hydroxy-tetrahydrodipicolinate synthase [Breznakibacter xylanolyticus]PZX18174.1 4-hydroxy-tetrahydrodipicolinate synthase [Breznakibacter xylanolyticus]